MAELVVLTGARAGALFELPDMPTILGRSPEAHFQLDDPWISSMHAMLERRGSDIWVVDLESRNGTFVSGMRVQEALLDTGCVLRFGRTEVRFERRGTRRSLSSARPTPPSVPVSRPTSRLDAPETTGPHGIVRVNRAPLDPLPLAARPVVLLQMMLHVASPGASPRAEAIRAAAETFRRVALDRGGLVVRLGAYGALAVFGAVEPTPGDVAQALGAARAAREDVATIDSALGVRAAVDRGDALVGNVDGPEGNELTVLGAVAERAEQVLALARAGEIVIGPGAIESPEVGPVQNVRVGGDELAIALAR